MKYTKPAISIPDQINLLEQRGLIFGDKLKAESYLSNISYYRLRAYTYPFQDNSTDQHPFIQKITFEQIIDLYVFDRHLRLLIFDAIEKIEIAFRTQIIYNYALSHGSFWHTMPQLYRDHTRFAHHIASMTTEIDRSNETFISHYKAKYTQPILPPCWMGLEVTSMGLLSKIFQNLSKSPQKRAIATHFGLTDIMILENWMHSFCNLRNICAHHGRIWNRRLSLIKIPYNTNNPFIQNNNIYANKLYATLACVEYVLKIISPKSTIKNKLQELMSGCPLKQEKEMGFPVDWHKDPFWN